MGGSDAVVDATLPRLTGRVVDGADILSAPTEVELTRELTRLEERTSDQLVVVTTPSLQGENIEELGMRLGRGWGVGHEKLDNGVLLIVAPTERKVRIEVGYGLEGLLTNERAAEIIQRDLLPDLRAENFDRAAKSGVAAIGEVLRAETRRPMPKPQKKAA